MRFYSDYISGYYCTAVSDNNKVYIIRFYNDRDDELPVKTLSCIIRNSSWENIAKSHIDYFNTNKRYYPLEI